jgi:hypothetical protein
MNKDQLDMVPAHHTIQTAYAALSGAQGHPQAEQVMGIAVLFHEVCTELRLDPSEMLDKARRVRRHAQDHFSNELRALGMYIEQEFKNG